MYYFMTSGSIRGAGIGLLMAASLGVCPAQVLPSPPELAAKVISLTGQVSVLHDSDPWALNVGDSVQVRQVIITGPDGYAQFQVSDGSTFEVYPNSQVVFRKNSTNWRDLLDMLVGRVKIHIEHWGGQPNPNRIMTPTAVISVRGTTFDVSVNEDDESTVVSVEEGVVDVRHALKPGVTRTVNAGESLRIYRNEPLAQSFVDKGEVARRVMHSLADALYEIMISPHGIHLPGSTPPICGALCTGQGGHLPPPPTTPPPPGAPGSSPSSGGH
jgi:FecR protein